MFRALIEMLSGIDMWALAAVAFAYMWFLVFLGAALEAL